LVTPKKLVFLGRIALKKLVFLGRIAPPAMNHVA